MVSVHLNTSRLVHSTQKRCNVRNVLTLLIGSIHRICVHSSSGVFWRRQANSALQPTGNFVHKLGVLASELSNVRRHLGSRSVSTSCAGAASFAGGPAPARPQGRPSASFWQAPQRTRVSEVGEHALLAGTGICFAFLANIFDVEAMMWLLFRAT